eukprot:Opistho-1_new@101189
MALKLDPDHQPEAANLGNRVAVANLREAVAQLAAARARVVEKALLLEHVERRNGRGARDRVAGVRAALAARGRLRHDVLARDNAGEGKARRESLGHDENVGDDVEVLDRKHVARASKARLDLVAHEQNVVLLANLLDARDEVGRRVDVAALAEDGLNHGARRFLRGALLVQKELKLLDAVVAQLRARERVGKLARVRVRRDVDAGHEGPKARAVNRLRGGHGHGADSAAVVRSLEHNHVLLARRNACRLHGRLDGLGARVPEVERVESLGNDLEELFGEDNHLVVEGQAALAVNERGDLTLRRLHDARVAVSGVGDSNAAGEVENLLALVRGHPAALARREHKVAEAADARRNVLEAELSELRGATNGLRVSARGHGHGLRGRRDGRAALVSAGAHHSRSRLEDGRVGVDVERGGGRAFERAGNHWALGSKTTRDRA